MTTISSINSLNQMDESLSIGGIIKSPLFKVFLKTKENRIIDTEIIPYVVNIKEINVYPRASLILGDIVKDFDIGLELHGIKYHLNEKMQLFMGRMKTDSGLYLPLTWSKYYTEIISEQLRPIAGSPFPVMGLDGTTDKNPLYLVYPEGDDYSLSFSFIIQKGFIRCFEDIPNLNKKYGEKFVHYFTNLSNSILEDRIKMPKENLERKVKKMNNASYNAASFIIKSPQIENPSEQGITPLSIDWKNPKSVVKYLDQYIIGQQEAKKRIAIALKKYRTRIETNDKTIEKGNLLLIGPTGTGKTYMMSVLAEAQEIPFIDVKASAKSQTGYTGENLSSAIFKQLLAKMKINYKESKKIYEPAGIIFIDEFDKFGSDKNSNEDMFIKLQQEIIGWAEEGNITLDKGEYASAITINTKNLLFVGAGAFSRVEGKHESLTDIINEKINIKKIGFNIDKEEKNIYDYKDLMSFISEEDLEKYGLMPELIGRFTERAMFNPLTLDELIAIFCKVKNSVYSSYKKIIEYDGYKLEMDEQVPRIIAENCSKETGARAIKTIASDIFNEILYEPERFGDKNKVIKLTPELVNNILSKSKGYNTKNKKSPFLY